MALTAGDALQTVPMGATEGNDAQMLSFRDGNADMAYYRREYHIYGRVQGVGFRYTVTYLARTYGMTGWVRNEYDGSVTVQLQGRNRDDFDYLIIGLHQDRFIRIDDLEYKDILPLEEETGFHVRY